MIFFSIVIPTYNRADFIDKTIQSILKQTYNHYEIIVVDDGSTDNTKEVVKAITDTKVNYYKKINAERGAARNYGATKAKGDYVNFFDSDDLALPNHLETALETIEKNNNPEIFHLFYNIKTIEGNSVRTPSPIKNINKQIVNGNFLSCNGVFIRKDIAVKNPFHEDRNLSASEDYLLWLKLAAQYKIHHNNTITSTIIEHDDRSVININKDGLILRKELMLKYALQDENIITVYRKKIHLLKSNTYSYIALHLAMAKIKQDSLIYLLKSIRVTPLFCLKKRFFAIVKHLVS